MAQKDIKGYVIPLGRGIAEEMGYDLIDAELVKEGPGRYLRIYVDKEGGFTLDDCERFHRAIQPRLEAVDYDFLEVSSPGVDRPLKTDRDYARALGKEMAVRLYKPLEGRKAFEGVLEAYDGDTLTLRLPTGDTITFSRKETAQVKPIIHFNDEDEEWIENE